ERFRRRSRDEELRVQSHSWCERLQLNSEIKKAVVFQIQSATSLSSFSALVRVWLSSREQFSLQGWIFKAPPCAPSRERFPAWCDKHSGRCGEVGTMAFALSMRAKCAVVVIVLAMTCGVSSTGAKAEDHSPVIDVPSADLEMAAAIARARATLQTFWASWQA